METEHVKKSTWIAVIIVAFGYFVDLYDLMLFSSVRIASLKELGITGDQASHYAVTLMNYTVAGMLAGGFFWGWLADKYGRLMPLFASIITYTIANIINAFVQDITTYEVCRFIAGFGLAGELGVGITLISESLPSKLRSYATTIVSSIGMLGAAFAGGLTYYIGQREIVGLSSWRFLFLFGAALGIILLIFRVSIKESSLFIKSKTVKTRGNILYLLSSKKRAIRFLFCFAVGTPIFYIIGNFVALSPEYGKLDGLNTIEASFSVLVCYLSICIADIIGTLLSKYYKSRKKIIIAFLVIQIISIACYLFIPVQTNVLFYCKIAFLGISIGGWGTIIINSAEQFGTDLRALVTTSTPNLIRFILVIQTYLIYMPLKSYIGLHGTAILVSAISLAIAIFSIFKLEDKFENNMDFNENN
jgi:putative MFS transporter